MNTAKCPHCGKTQNHLKLERVFIHEHATKWKGINIICPGCNTIISSSVDHLTLQDVLIDRIKKLLGR